MKNVLIVDDDTIMRVTLRSLISWEKFGLQIAGECNSGAQALEYLSSHTVDLMITDVKMPEMSGIELLRSLQDGKKTPVTIMLSGYDEYDLVREAFRLGAYDYLMKADLNKKNIECLITEINRKFWHGVVEEGGIQEETEGSKPEFQMPDCGTYGIVILEIDDFQRQAVRFQEDLDGLLERPMWDLAAQIPKIKRNGKVMTVQHGHYVLFYAVTMSEGYHSEIVGLVRRLQTIWKNYMNLLVSAAVCEAKEAADLKETIEFGENLLLLSPLEGMMSLHTEWEKRSIAERLEKSKKKYGKFLSLLYDLNEPGSEREKLILFQSMEELPLETAKEECLSLIALLALKFREYDGDFYRIFPEDVNYYEKVGRLLTMTELERWFNNYSSWILEYLKQQTSGIQTDLILRAKRFVADNYSNPELTLKTVADYVDLNEKYFSTKFTQKTGGTFRDYLTSLRLEKAEYLLKRTDLKIYEICDQIGYNNVEHFNRMFKRMIGKSPNGYRKDSGNFAPDEGTDKTSRN
ncbi:response regulator transcription factor [Blautia producta]|uniref:Stage 0 sporulation protein A homolog n=1 Tax=Blautia producta TaxID=33035 RepID=A0A4P6M133_9FIRM|nr:response regulator [Blautia producta]QBE97300.1 Chemotaxis protein CheY [Blautia producta]